MRATFYVFDLAKAAEDPERKQAFAELLFTDIDNLQIEGFTHQNPITFLFIDRDESGIVPVRRFRVEWGGSIGHGVSFFCSRISVLRVIDLNPFQKSIREP